MTIVIQIEGLVNGQATPWDGEYIVEYDPSREGDFAGLPVPIGWSMPHLVTTPDVAKATQFVSIVDAHELWTRVDARHPVRADGRPNRPLTAFTVAFVSPEV